MPFRQEMSPDYMLASIFSCEIPMISQSHVNWLSGHPAERLARWGVNPGEIPARGFYPRSLLAAHCAAQLLNLVTAGIAAGHKVEVRTGHDILDVIPGRGATLVFARNSERIIFVASADLDELGTDFAATTIGDAIAMAAAETPAKPLPAPQKRSRGTGALRPETSVAE